MYNMYDFDNIINRRNTGSYKWNVAEDELPMWVADMDFETAPEIVEAIKDRCKHGIFGYNDVTDDWYDAYTDWWARRHNFSMSPDELMFVTGVVPAISSTVRKLTTPGENVVIMTPVYNIFFNSIRNNGRNVLESPLHYSKRSGRYSIDFGDLEDKLSDPQTSLLILCNPHNPCGNVWSKDELMTIAELAYMNNVVVLSDEIHCEFTNPGISYIPFASVSETAKMNSITCIAPTKAFNLAGLQTAAIYVPNPQIRHKVWRGINTDEVAEPNSFAVIAAVAAFTKGEAWLDELRTYIYDNKLYAEEFIKKNIPGIKVVKSESTYLLWLDVRKYTECSSDFAQYIRFETGLYLSSGEIFGSDGNHFLRMNVACPRTVLTDGLNRLYKGVNAYNSLLRKKR